MPQYEFVIEQAVLEASSRRRPGSVQTNTRRQNFWLAHCVTAVISTEPGQTPACAGGIDAKCKLSLNFGTAHDITFDTSFVSN